ncbi:galactose-1-phosphate uridylyltransferase, partial [Bifidobacterium sp.]
MNARLEADEASLAQVYAAIDALVQYAMRRLELDVRDADWARNRIFELFGLESYAPTGATSDDWLPDEPLTRLCEAAVKTGLCMQDEQADYADAVMGILSMPPAALQNRFGDLERDRGGMAAMRWLYDYCVANNYVKQAVLERNPRFDAHGLTVTINLAKPEFTTMTKAAASNAVAGGYPQCTICHANEGFAGRARRTLRTVPVQLGGEPWFWQFSPYGYFDQHGICVNMRHIPMRVDRDTFGHLLDFVDRFPGYFLGCNAALPRIGGSVLAHDHYQGGGGTLPMHHAKAWKAMWLPDCPDARVEILDWPGTAVRVVSRSRSSIIAISEIIREAWIGYTNLSLGIVCEDGDGKRSALSPSVIVTERGYEMSLILRNNGVSAALPEGIFHAHPEFWPIKQEPIGLIEAQGLFILPGRLIRQLGEIEDALVSGGALPRSVCEFELEWRELTARLGAERGAGRGHDRASVRAAIRDELGSICVRILGNTAVFKDKSRTADFLRGSGLCDWPEK